MKNLYAVLCFAVLTGWGVQAALAAPENEQGEIKKAVIERCLENENNTAQQCQCFAQELFEKFSVDQLKQANSRAATAAQREALINWTESKPCGVDYPLHDD